MSVQEKMARVPEVPALWQEAAPVHFDSAWPGWVKWGIALAALAVAFAVDQRVAAWAIAQHWFWDFGDPQARHGDLAREAMMLEQFGQWTCSVLIIATVVLLDRAGRRKALALAIGCVLTVLLCYLLKDVVGRPRPNTIGIAGTYQFLGPAKGFRSSDYGSFPSAHTTGAFALAAGLAWFYPRGRGLFYFLALMTAGQRIVHHAHYVSDVIAGMILAVTTVRLSLRGKLAGRVIAACPAGARAWWMGTEAA